MYNLTQHPVSLPVGGGVTFSESSITMTSAIVSNPSLVESVIPVSSTLLLSKHPAKADVIISNVSARGLTYMALRF